MAKGRFLTVEGSEGVGKSTNIAFIKEQLLAAGIDLILTREPGGTPLAEEMREILLAKREEKFDATAELLVVFAARAQHLNAVIRPALDAGTWVLCDRFTDATFAYQGAGRGLSKSLILQLEASVQAGLHPDKTFLLDIDVGVGLARARARAELDRFEEEEIAFFERVRQGYLERVQADPDRYYIIDAAQPLDVVQRDISEKVQLLLRS